MGWRDEVRCDGCGASLAIDAGARTHRCPFCDAASVVTRAATPGRPQPAFAIGFAVEREAAEQAVVAWIRGRRMGPFGLARAAAERITGLYLPVYLYAATARTQYRASIGEQYRGFSVSRGDEGGVSLGREDKTEYRDLAGRRIGAVADVLVTASRGLGNDEIDAIEPFDVSRLRRYVPALVAGWASEEPSLTPEEAVPMARAEAQAWVARTLRAFMPGDEVRTLEQQTDLADEALDLALVPVWVFAMRYSARQPPVRVLVNGQTGRVGGAVPLSWAKVGLIAIVAVLVAAMLAALAIAAVASR